MKKKALFAATIALTIAILTPAPVSFAASPSPSPDGSASGSASINEITDNLRTRLQETIQNASDSATATTVAYIGSVKDVVNDTIVMDTKDGRKNIAVGGDTTIVRTHGQRTIKIDNVQIGDSAIAIGTPSAEDELAGTRIVVSANPITPPAKTSGYGTIQGISRGVLTLFVPGQSDPVVVETDGNTVVKTPSDLLTLKDLALGDTIIYTADLDKNNNQTATIIMQIATPSPTPSPTPSASPAAKRK